MACKTNNGGEKINCRDGMKWNVRLVEMHLGLICTVFNQIN